MRRQVSLCFRDTVQTFQMGSCDTHPELFSSVLLLYPAYMSFNTLLPRAGTGSVPSFLKKWRFREDNSHHKFVKSRLVYLKFIF